MTNEEKQILLKDLCARLPFGVICKSKYIEYDEIDGDDVEWDKEGKIEVIGDDYVIINSYQCEIDETKPYLRPMSSMTEEEWEEWRRYKSSIAESSDELLDQRIDELHDWFYRNHIDFRGLIPKGLALEAPVDMYNLK